MRTRGTRPDACAWPVESRVVVCPAIVNVTALVSGGASFKIRLLVSGGASFKVHGTLLCESLG